MTNIGIRPSFFQVPYDQQAVEGKLVRFDCLVGGRPEPEVNWYREGRLILDTDRFKVVVNEGGVHALMIMAVYPCDTGSYTCVASNPVGDTSFTVRLVVVEKEQTVAPKFVDKFQATDVKEGQSVRLECRASGTPAPRMMWQKDGEQIYSRPPDIEIQSHEGSSVLIFNRARPQDSGWYQCTAQNQAGMAAIRAKLHVEGQKKVLVGEPVKIMVPKTHRVIEPEKPPPSEVIYLRHLERTYYEVPPQRPQETQESEPQPQPPPERRPPPPPPKPTFTTQLRDLVLNEGERAHFEARLTPSADPSMKIEWYLNGTQIESSSRVLTTFRFGYTALTIIHVYPEDSGIISCKAINNSGESISTATLKCNPVANLPKSPPFEESIQRYRMTEDSEFYKRERTVEESTSTAKPCFVKPLMGVKEVTEGGSAFFEAQVTPIQDPTTRIEWFLNGQPLDSSQ